MHIIKNLKNQFFNHYVPKETYLLITFSVNLENFNLCFFYLDRQRQRNRHLAPIDLF